MTHGWPGSVIELLETVGPLTDPTAHGGRAEDAFDLVLPSFPGYGFSGEPAELGWNAGRVAPAWAELMRRLGYTRYVAQGGDVGAAVTDAMGRQAPEGLVGIHTNLLVTALAGGPLPAGVRGGTRGPRRDRDVQGERLRLLPGAGDPAADDRLRAAGLTGRPRGLAARPRHGQLRQDLPRLRRRAARGQPHPGPHPRQHHPLLADRHRRLGRPLVLGERASPGRSRGRPGAPGGGAPGRLHHVPGRDLPRPRAAGSSRLPQPHLLQRGRQGRPLRGLGGAAAVLEEMRAAFRSLRGDSEISPFRALRQPPADDAPGRGRAAVSKARMPSLDGATGWLNSPPLTPAGCAGRSCSSTSGRTRASTGCARFRTSAPGREEYESTAWSCVGVHTPEFPFEHDLDNVRRAARTCGSTTRSPSTTTTRSGTPSTTTTGRRCTSSTREGRIRHHHFGEGDYEQSELVIQQLLAEAGAAASAPAGLGRGQRRGGGRRLGHPRSPETYLGYERAETRPPGGADLDTPAVYTAPARLRLNHWALSGDWTLTRRGRGR